MIGPKLITFFILFLLLAGCSTSITSLRAPTTSTKLQETVRQEDNTVSSGTKTAARPRAVRIVVLQDKSRSVNQTRTTQMTEEDFSFLIDLLRETSGEIAFGIVDERSDKPLVRLRVDPRPARPSAPKATNPFERAELNAAYDEELLQYASRVKSWSTETERRVEAFMIKLQPLLQEKATAGRTNVYEAIARINLFAGESEASWPSHTNIYAVVNSDAIDTVHSKPITIDNRLKLLLINGAGSTGVLGRSDPLRFESVQPALDFIRATERGADPK